MDIAGAIVSAAQVLANGSDTYSPVGISDPVRMEYEIRIGYLDHGPGKKIVDTESFKVGVSVASVSWGFNSPGSTAAKESSKLTLTIHDIAGSMIDTVSKLRSGTTYLYFKGPTCKGKLWFGKWAIYAPIAEECTIEFNQMSGFTYTISAEPMHKLVEKQIFVKRSITLTGSDAGANATFEKYLTTEFQKRFNNILDEDPDKVSSATINITVDKSIANVEIAKDQLSKDGRGFIMPITIEPNTSVANAIRKIFTERFEDPEDLQQHKDGEVHKRFTIQVTLESAKNGVLEIGVYGIDSKTETSVTTDMPICIGDDKNCKGWFYRGQLVNMQIPNNIYQQLTIQSANMNIESNDFTQAGNDDHITDVAERVREEFTGFGGDYTVDTNNPLNANLGTNMGGFGSAFTNVLKNYKYPDFVIEVELPYSYGFTPKKYGGLLEDAIPFAASGAGIHITQGAILSFFWYTDPDCASLSIVPGISGQYRIIEVTHTIGLNGNTTQLKLSHFILSKQ